MKKYLVSLRLWVLVVAASAAFGAESDGWRQLFNGKDLSGWVPVQVAANTFTVRDGMIVSTGVPTGVMRTDRQYENFELELEWKHIVPQGNAGLFVWSYPITAVGQPFTKSIEVQILDGRNGETYTSHGDIFSIHGARMKPDRPHPKGAERCLPSEWRCKPAGEWNHYRVVCSNGVVKLSVNGKEVSGGSECTPRKGYICLESEGTECHFRNIRIKELPSTNPKPEEIAPEDEGFVSIYNGLNLDGWTTKAPEHWKAKDWVLQHDGAVPPPAHLWYAKPLEAFTMILDWRVVDKNAAQRVGLFIRVPEGKLGSEREGLITLKSDRKPGEWNRSIITVSGDSVKVLLNDRPASDWGPVIDGLPQRGQIGLQAQSHAVEFGNIYIKELK